MTVWRVYERHKNLGSNTSHIFCFNDRSSAMSLNSYFSFIIVCVGRTTWSSLSNETDGLIPFEPVQYVDSIYCNVTRKQTPSLTHQVWFIVLMVGYPLFSYHELNGLQFAYYQVCAHRYTIYFVRHLRLHASILNFTISLSRELCNIGFRCNKLCFQQDYAAER